MGWLIAFLLIGLMVYSLRPQQKDEHLSTPVWLLPVSTGKQKKWSGSNKDASMYTQSQRRFATTNGYFASGRTMKETTHTTGFTTGALELSSIGAYCRSLFVAEPPAPAIPSVLDGLDAPFESNIIFDGSGNGDLVLDGGDANYV